MKLKKSVSVLMLVIFLTNFIIAQDDAAIDKAYSCLEDELGDNCGGTKSTKQNAFNLLAISYSSSLQSGCESSLKNKLKGNCWGETDTGSCNIKSTALSILALNHIQDDVDDYVNWLLSKRIENTGLTWYLEIDTNNKTECTINGKKVVIESDKKISGSPPPGLLKTYNDYWFEIKDISKNYTISCDKDFITALLYQQPGNSVFHVTSETKSASEFDTIVERVSSYCFSTSNSCDYEGSLWASIALAKLGEDVSPYLPYITTMADKTENKMFIHSAFLYILTHSDDYYSELISIQKSSNYWDESKNKFYDTALALLALSDVSSDETERARKYLISVQKETGCWQSDTSFILHAVWPKSPAVSGKVGISNCEEFGYYCVSFGECSLQNTLDNFYCPSSAQICCSQDFLELTCTEKGGVICNLDQECKGDEVYSSDSLNCCIGDCVQIEQISECENQGHICKTSCNEDTEEEKISYSNSCSFGDVCCSKKPVQEKKVNLLLILALVILIILVILAIIFRKRLREFFRRKGIGKPGGTGRPFGGLPSGLLPVGRGFLPPRPPAGIPSRGHVQREPTRDKEFEETMKKLREMSK